ncbi:DUF6600 domain-containing protein [Duganella sp. S19_KUP01_CR8]|uniref:DUF6600 domain-containing protein n=1 Tax=Duganella sp. S19_KUP01_CR8 TaxID=3025502 RepID=UPI002FCDC9B2
MAIRSRFLLALGGAAWLCSAAAQADPPARVARLAYVNGAVSYAAAGADDWQTAGINRPLVAGDRLWTASGARDELRAGPAAVRMDGETLLTLLNAGDTTTQLQLSQGRLNLRVRQLRPDEVLEIDTPNLAFSIRKPGHYRIQVDASGNATQVAVIDGQGEAYGDNTSYLVAPGQAYRFTGTGLQDFSVAQLPPADDFDQWSAQRDRRLEHPAAARYVSSDVVGYEDLDDNGSWRDVPGYGNMWMPARVAPDWAPYRDGHWSWVEPWGWTWVDDAPWGFAVTHYGRWAQTPAGWGWLPGPVVQRPVYAPALVVFVGAATLLLGDRPDHHGVAWFPLGPREVYRPSYRASPTYVTNINTSNTVINKTQITNVYNNVNITNVRYANRQAVTAMPATAFAQAQPVRQNLVRVSPQALAAAPLAAAAAVRPQHAPPLGGAAGARPAPAILARPVVAKTAPAMVMPPPVAHAGTPVQGAAQAAANIRMARAERPKMAVPAAPAATQQLAQKGGAHGAQPPAPVTPALPLTAHATRQAEVPPQAALHPQPAPRPQPDSRPPPVPHPQPEAHPPPAPHQQVAAHPPPAPHPQAVPHPQPAPHPQAEVHPPVAQHAPPAPHPPAAPKAPPQEQAHVPPHAPAAHPDAHPHPETQPHREAQRKDPKHDTQRE